MQMHPLRAVGQICGQIHAAMPAAFVNALR